jgi:phosphate transport system permease protein
MRGLFLASACVCILAVLAICAFLFVYGVPFFSKYSLLDFVTGTEWAPLRGVFGILPMIVGSFYVTLGALLLGAPVGILTAILMARFAGKGVVKVMKPRWSMASSA